MQKAHGCGYKEYSQQLEKILLIEKRREKDYLKSQRVVQETKKI